MSNWTHVAGIIRVDDFGRCLGNPPLNFTELIGKEIDDWDNVKDNPSAYLPYGSEGSLQMIGKNTEVSLLSRFKGAEV